VFDSFVVLFEKVPKTSCRPMAKYSVEERRPRCKRDFVRFTDRRNRDEKSGAVDVKWRENGKKERFICPAKQRRYVLKMLSDINKS
ncbi:MAG: hypothetical protein RR459_04820, partial [Christensenellaceae bacterium]